MVLRYLEQFQINIYAIMMLLVILLIIRLRSRVEFYSKKILKTIILLNIIGLIMDPVTWIFDGNPAGLGFVVSYGSNMLLVLLSPVLAGFSVSYMDYKVFRDRGRLHRRYYYLLPAVFIGILLTINFFHPVFFSFDPVTGIYETAPLQWILYIVIIGIYFYVSLLLYKHRSQTNTRLIAFVVMFFALPIIGMLVQSLFVRLNFAWTTISLGILIAYAFLESTTGEKDYLTQLYSRASYEEFVRFLIEEERPFRIMMMDLDGFKAINDQFGHYVGDQVLIEFSNLLHRVAAAEKMIARLAGDEFVVVLEKQIQDDEQIVQSLIQQCRQSSIPQVQMLHFSYGIQEYRSEMTYDELYIQVDHAMYLNKHT